MAAPKTPQQIHDRGDPVRDDNWEARRKFVADNGSLGFDPLSFPSVTFEDLNTRVNAACEAYEEAGVIRASHLENVKAALEDFEVLDLINPILSSLKDEPGDIDMVVDTFCELAEKDPLLAIELHRRVNKIGEDVMNQWRRDIAKVKSLVHDADIPGKSSLLKDLRRQIEGHMRTMDAQNTVIELLKQKMNELSVDKIRLQVELETRPIQAVNEPSPADNERQEAIRKVLQQSLGIDAGFPQNWSELKDLTDDIFDQIKDKMEDKRKQWEEAVNDAEGIRKQAVDLLKAEQHAHMNTKHRSELETQRRTDLQEQLAKAYENVNEWKERHHNQQDVTKDLKAQLDKSQETSDINARDLKRAKAQIEECKERNDSYAKEEAKLRAEIRELKESNAEEAAQHGGEVQLLGSKYSAEVSKLQACQEDVSNQRERIIELERQLKDTSTDLEQATNRSTRLEAERDEAQIRIEELEKTITAKNEKISSQADTIATSNLTRESLANAEKQISALQREAGKFTDLMVQTKQGHQNSIDMLAKNREAAVQHEKSRTKEVYEKLTDCRAEVLKNVREHDKKVAVLEARLQDCEKNNTAMQVKLQNTENLYIEQQNICRREKTNVELERKRVSEKDEYITGQVRIIRQLRDKIDKQAGVSSQLTTAVDINAALNHQLTLKELESKQQHQTIVESRENIANLQHIVIRWGFGGEVRDLDLTILDELQKLQPISNAALARRCKDWESAIRCGLSTERITAFELWILSLSDPARIDVATIYGFVKSHPIPVHLVFLEAAVRNVANLPELTFEQCFFVLRGLELLWMSLPGKGILMEILPLCVPKLHQGALIQGLHNWLQGVLYGMEVSHNDEILQLLNEPLMVGGVTIFGNENLLMASDGITFITSREALRVEVADDGTSWVVVIEGFPSGFRAELEMTGENFKLLTRSFPDIK